MKLKLLNFFLDSMKGPWCRICYYGLAGAGVGVNLKFTLFCLIWRYQGLITLLSLLTLSFLLNPHSFVVSAMEARDDPSLIHDVRDEAFRQRVNRILEGPRENREALLAELTRISSLLVDNVEPLSYSQRISGCESIILWVSCSIILFLATRNWVEIRDFLFRSVDTVGEAALNLVPSNERVRAIAWELYKDPRTKDAVLELILRADQS